MPGLTSSRCVQDWQGNHSLAVLILPVDSPIGEPAVMQSIKKISGKNGEKHSGSDAIEKIRRSWRLDTILGGAPGSKDPGSECADRRHSTDCRIDHALKLHDIDAASNMGRYEYLRSYHYTHSRMVDYRPPRQRRKSPRPAPALSRPAGPNIRWNVTVQRITGPYLPLVWHVRFEDDFSHERIVEFETSGDSGELVDRLGCVFASDNKPEYLVCKSAPDWAVSCISRSARMSGVNFRYLV